MFCTVLCLSYTGVFKIDLGIQSPRWALDSPFFPFRINRLLDLENFGHDGVVLCLTSGKAEPRRRGCFHVWISGSTFHFLSLHDLIYGDGFLKHFQRSQFHSTSGTWLPLQIHCRLRSFTFLTVQRYQSGLLQLRLNNCTVVGPEKMDTKSCLSSKFNTNKDTLWQCKMSLHCQKR